MINLIVCVNINSLIQLVSIRFTKCSKAGILYSQNVIYVHIHRWHSFKMALEVTEEEIINDD